jgi:hypothetical protein
MGGVEHTLTGHIVRHVERVDTNRGKGLGRRIERSTFVEI